VEKVECNIGVNEQEAGSSLVIRTIEEGGGIKLSMDAFIGVVMQSCVGSMRQSGQTGDHCNYHADLIFPIVRYGGCYWMDITVLCVFLQFYFIEVFPKTWNKSN